MFFLGVYYIYSVSFRTRSILVTPSIFPGPQPRSATLLCSEKRRQEEELTAKEEFQPTTTTMVKVLTYFGMTLAAFAFWQSMDKVHVWIALHQDEKVSILSSSVIFLFLSLSLSVKSDIFVIILDSDCMKFFRFPVNVHRIQDLGQTLD